MKIIYEDFYGTKCGKQSACQFGGFFSAEQAQFSAISKKHLQDMCREHAFRSQQWLSLSKLTAQAVTCGGLKQFA